MTKFRICVVKTLSLLEEKPYYFISIGSFYRAAQLARIRLMSGHVSRGSAGEETLKSLLHHHSSKASILQCSAFFTVQLSHPYMTTGKTIALTRRTFVGKVMSLLFSMLSRLVWISVKVALH